MRREPMLATAQASQNESHVGTMVERARRGDESAFEALYRENVGRVHALCLRMSGDGRRAEELTQDVFVRAWTKLDSFRGDAAFSTWLHRLAVNVVLQKKRTDKRRRARVEARETLPEPTRRVALERPTARMDLERALRSLPEKARMVFLLHDVHGYKHREIAEMMGTAEGTAKAQLHRARKLMREALER